MIAHAAEPTAPPALADPAEIVRALRVILAPGQVTELRALDATTAGDRWPQTYSGYFDDVTKLAQAAATLRTARAVYILPNRLKPALLARSVNRIRQARKDPLTSDGDVERRRWLLIDCDADRPAGVSATEEEHEAALARAAEIRDYLTESDWPAPVYGDSGNGGHLMYRIDLPADDGGLVKRCLEVLADKFPDGGVKVDTSVYNPARVWKLYGTKAGKGDDAGEECGRPHRMARLIESPDVLEIVTPDLLHALAKQPTRAEREDQDVKTTSWQGGRTQRYSANGNGRVQFNIDDWIRSHGLDVDGPEDYRPAAGGVGRKWVFRVCPFNSDHTNRSASIIQFPSGAVGFQCLHDGCGAYEWRDLRRKFEPDYDPDRWERDRFRRDTAAAGRNGDGPNHDNATVIEAPSPVTLGELWNADPNLREPVIDGLLRRGCVGNCISTSKSYKTYLMLGLAVAMTQGRQWLDYFGTIAGGRVLYIDLELQRPDIVRRTRDIAEAMHAPLTEVGELIHIHSLRGRNVSIEQLEPMLLGYPTRAYDLVIIDPLYKTYPADFDENSNPQMTNLYRRFERIAEHMDAAILVVHHASKGSQSEKTVIDVGAGAGAQARSPDAHIAIRPHEEDDCVVFESRVRSFRPPDPLVLRWRYPQWERDLGLDPKALRGGKRGRNEDKAQPQPKTAKPVWTPEKFAAEFVTADPQAKDVILSRAGRADGLSVHKARGLMAEAEAAKLVHRHAFTSDNRLFYATREQTLVDTPPCVTNVPPTPPVGDQSRHGAREVSHTDTHPRRNGKQKGGAR